MLAHAGGVIFPSAMSINLLQKYKCGNCGRVFNDHELICEDHRDPQKSIICPDCRYYLEVPRNPKRRLVIFAFLMALAVVLVLSQTSDIPIDALIAGSLFFVALPVYLWAYGNPYVPLKTNAIGKSEI